MQTSTDRILTTHTGSIARPDDLIELMRAKENGQPYDHEAFEARATAAVEECVRRQVEAGLDVINDGEQRKSGFTTYLTERLDGFEAVPYAPGETPGSLAGSGRVPRVLRALLQDRDVRSHVEPADAAGMPRTGQVRRPGGTRHRPRQSASGAGREELHRGLHVGGAANRPRPARERVLLLARRVRYRARRRDPRGVPGHHRRRPPDPAGRPGRDEPVGLRGCRASRAGTARGGDRRADQLHAQGHPAGEDPLPHLLRHQPGPAHLRPAAARLHRADAAGQRPGVLVRGHEPPAYARLPRLRGRQAARGQGDHPWAC